MSRQSSKAWLVLSATIPLLTLLSQPGLAQQAPFSAQTGEPMANVATLPGIEIGGQISDYRYQEHVVSNSEYMRETGIKVGLTGSVTKFIHNGIFLTGDFRFAFSSNDYANASGAKQDGIPDYLFDIRVLAGKDFFATGPLMQGSYIGITPFIGLGYRNLYNDWGGRLSDGKYGYSRDSQYFYLPVGVTHRFGIGGDARISLTTEYDQLIEGWQETNLSDISPDYSNATSRQHGGFGLRGSVMYERPTWSIGPFVNYWNINQSDTSSYIYRGQTGRIVEPHNQTIEYGLQARYRF